MRRIKNTPDKEGVFFILRKRRIDYGATSLQL